MRLVDPYHRGIKDFFEEEIAEPFGKSTFRKFKITKYISHGSMPFFLALVSLQLLHIG